MQNKYFENTTYKLFIITYYTMIRLTPPAKINVFSHFECFRQKQLVTYDWPILFFFIFQNQIFFDRLPCSFCLPLQFKRS